MLVFAKKKNPLVFKNRTESTKYYFKLIILPTYIKIIANLHFIRENYLPSV